MQVFANICRYIQIPNRHQKNHIDVINSHRSDKIVYKKKKNDTVYGYSLLTRCLFASKKNQIDFYRGEDFIKEFCANLKEHVNI